MSWSASLSGHVHRPTAEEAKAVEEEIARVLHGAAKQIHQITGEVIFGSFGGQHHQQPLEQPPTSAA